MNPAPTDPGASAKSGYNRFLLLVAGLGGLLFGVDVGIISGALPYLQETSGLTGNQISIIVAAVLLGSVISSLFAGVLADLIGRKPMMIFSGVLFVVSVPVIALSHSYGALIFGRLLQGISGGLIGVGIPLYLAECLSASSRGKGTGIFQWMLTLGIVVAAIIGFYWSGRVDEMTKLADPQKLFAFKDAAWRGIFWVSLPPGILFVLGAFMVSESPRWLFRRGNKDAARAALLRSRSEAQAEIELREMEEVATTEKAGRNAAGKHSETLFQRKYVIPFILACIILACNQATGINSIIGYNTTIFIQAGLSDYWAHLGGVIQTVVNFLMTIVAVILVDRKGRKFLLSVGSGGVIISLLCIGMVFHATESRRVDAKAGVQSLVDPSSQSATVEFNGETIRKLLQAEWKDGNQPCTLVVIYSYGDFKAATKVVRSDVPGAKLTIDRASCVPDTKVAAFFQNPFANLEAARTAPLKIEHAIITPVPSTNNGWLTAGLVYCFMAFFAMGPGVCVWLALSELMPTRIRSKGMSVALLINHCVSTTIAAFFLPTVGQYGYSTMFFIFAGCTVVYFITAAFFLPETKGKTLEEIEEHFEGKH
ncbi:MAG TPA: MFS transporter [Candidatus Acidoferrales bacterium]|jgi:SP family myo-inositol transporter-like MFS transporter 13|nr:MFS transporter [Candidatus Acidoferrales bacterium]